VFTKQLAPRPEGSLGDLPQPAEAAPATSAEGETKPAASG
jgi:hypothetical protein